MGNLPFEEKRREVLIKKPAKTSDQFGEDPYGRSVDTLIEYGVVNLDKVKGPTSHQVSAYIQKILGINKAGHSGTLDPKVTGVLPVMIGRGTRVVQTLLTAGKEYVCIMHLHSDVPEEQIRLSARKFVGKIRQLPPIKSAVKRDWRYRKIYYLEILEIKGKDVLFRVGCQAGTYIRKLCHDWAEAMGTGGHMAELRRTKAGPFNEETYLSTLQDIQDALWYYKNENNETYIRNIIRPVEEGVQHLPKIWVLDSAVDTICHGSDLGLPGISKLSSGIEPDLTVAIMTLKDELVAIGDAKLNSAQILKEKNGLAVDIKKVFMLPGTYPKIKRDIPLGE